jgi:hypothetical protein
LLTTRLTAAQQVYADQPTDFSGQSPVVVVASGGSERDGSPRRTFGGPIAPSFALDVYVFALAGEANVDDTLDDLEAAVAQFVSDVPSAATWSAISYGAATETQFVTVVDGTEYKRERIPLVLTGR